MIFRPVCYPGKSTTIEAVVQPRDTVLESDSVRFRTSSGAKVLAKKTRRDSIFHLTVQGQSNTQVRTVEAYVPYRDSTGKKQEKIIGRCKVISYNTTTNDLVVVPLNDARSPRVTDIKTRLNSIFKSSLATWNVTLEDPLSISQEKWDKNEDEALDYEAFARKYSKEMRTIYSYYENERSLEDDTYYLFLTNFPVKGSLKAYMPFKGQFTFISADEVSSKDLPRVLAHELGHGTFRLYHTFSDKCDYPVARGTTDNIMDYNQGTQLHKYQWDNIQEPRNILFEGLIEEEEQKEIYDVVYVDFSTKENNMQKYVSNNTITYITPSGAPATLSKNASPNFTGTLYYTKNQKPASIPIADGPLLSFKDKNGTYWGARFKKKKGKWYFKGYRERKNGKYIDNYKNFNLNKKNIGSNPTVIGKDPGCTLELYQGHCDFNNTQTSTGEGYVINDIQLDKKTLIGKKNPKVRCLDGLAKKFYKKRSSTEVISNIELYNIANLIQKLGDTHFKEYEYMADKGLNDFENFLLNLGGATKKYYIRFKESLKEYLEFKKNLREDITQTNPENIIKFVRFLTPADLELLTVNHRMHLLRQFKETELTNNWFFGNGGEALVIAVLKSTPGEQIKDLFNALNKGTLIEDLTSHIQNSAIGNNNMNNFVRELVVLFYSQDKSTITDAKKFAEVFTWHRSQEYDVLYDVSYDEAGNITFSADLDYLTDNGNKRKLIKNYEESTPLEPMDIVSVNFTTKVDFIGLEKTVFPAPAIFFKWMIDQYQKERTKEAINFLVDLASFCVAYGEAYKAVKYGAKSWKIALRLASLMQTSGNIYFELNEKTVNKLEDSEEGRIFLNTWNGIDKMLDGKTAYKKIINQKFPVFISLKLAWNKFSTEQKDFFTEKEKNKIEQIIDAINNGLN